MLLSFVAKRQLYSLFGKESVSLIRLLISYLMAGLHSRPAAFDQAFEKLKGSVTVSDAREFQSTTLSDVRTAALEIQQKQRERRSLLNLGRLAPFFKGLEKYSKVVEVLCNGTPYLPWVWVSDSECSQHVVEVTKLITLQAPIKLMLQVLPTS